MLKQTFFIYSVYIDAYVNVSVHVHVTVHAMCFLLSIKTIIFAVILLKTPIQMIIICVIWRL